MPEHSVYAVASGKGGVGKTATTVNLGAALAERGYSVVLVDADLGMANLGGYLGVGEEGQTLHEVLAGDADLEAAVYDVGEGLSVVPSGITLDGFANVETAALSDAVDALRDAFDYVLLDIGAGLSHDNVLPLALADAVLLVSTPKPLSLQDTAKTREITERLGGAIAGAVLTRAGQLGELDLDAVGDQLGIPVLAVVPEDQAVQEAANDGRPVIGSAPHSPAAEGYRGLADIVIQESLAEAPVVPELPTPSAGTEGAPAKGVGSDAEVEAGDEAAEEAAEPATAPDEEALEEPTGADEVPADGGAVEADAEPPAETEAEPEAGPPDETAAEEAPPEAEAEQVADEAEPVEEPADASPEPEPAAAAADSAGEPENPDAGDAEPVGESEPAADDDGEEREFAPEPDAETTAADIAAAIEEATEGDGGAAAADLDLEADADVRPESGDEGGLRIESAEDRAERDRGDEEADAELHIEGADDGDEDEEEDSGGLLSRLFGG